MFHVCNSREVFIYFISNKRIVLDVTRTGYGYILVLIFLYLCQTRIVSKYLYVETMNRF